MTALKGISLKRGPGGIGNVTGPAGSTIQGLASYADNTGTLLDSNPNLVIANNRLTVLSPLASTDVANKAYVDAFVSGLTYLSPAVVATTANIVGTYNNGASGVGATITVTATGPITIDGVAVALNDSVLFKDQTSTFQNGVYTQTTLGSTGVSPVFTRRTDFNSASNISEGSYIGISSGTTNKGTTYIENGNGPFVVGTTPITFQILSIFVTSITGTANQVIASSATGAVVLSLPQDINTTSSPTFAGLTSPLGASGLRNAQFLQPINGTQINATAYTVQLSDGGKRIPLAAGGVQLTLPPYSANIPDGFSVQPVLVGIPQQQVAILKQGTDTLNGVAILYNNINGGVTTTITKYGSNGVDANYWTSDNAATTVSINYSSVLSVKAVQITNLAGAYDNGSSGFLAYLRNNGTLAPLTINGIAMNVGDRLLLSAQTNGYECGIYYVDTVGDSSTPWVIVRALDFCTSDQMVPGASFIVLRGTDGDIGTTWYLNNLNNIIVGTTSLVFHTTDNAGITTTPAIVTDIATTYVIDPKVGNYQILTATAPTAISFGATPDVSGGTQAQSIIIALRGEAITWPNDGTVSFSSSCFPIQDPTNFTYIQFIGQAGVWVGSVISMDSEPKTVAGASTVNLDVISSNLINISGSATIDTIVTTSGVARDVVFSGNSTLVHSSNLLLPNDGNNIVTSNRDTMRVIGFEGSSVSEVVNFTKADGTTLGGVNSITGTTNQVIASSSTGNITLSLPQDIATGSDVIFSTLTASTAFTLEDGAALRTSTTGGDIAYVSGYDNTNSLYLPFLTMVNGATPSFAWAQPANGTLTWDGGAIGQTTPNLADVTFLATSSSPSVTAAGSTYANATPLTSEINNLTTVANGTGATLPSVRPGTLVIVSNNGTHAAIIYATSPATINNIAGTVGVSLTNNTTGFFKYDTTNTWTFSISSTNQQFNVEAVQYQDLPATYYNGANNDGIGATLTITATGAVTIDNILTVVGHRYAFIAQNAGLQNGIYVLTTAGSTGVSAVFTRLANLSTSTQISHNVIPVFVTSGTRYDNSYIILENQSVTVGTTAITFISQNITAGRVSFSNIDLCAIDSTPIGAYDPREANFSLIGTTYADSVTATGSTVSDAFPLTTPLSNITAGAAGTGVILFNDTLNTGVYNIIYNNAANPIKVYTEGSGTINGIFGGITIPVGKAYRFDEIGTDVWLYADYVATGVTSLTGTANQIAFSASTGDVTASLPQNIGTGSDVVFNSLQAILGQTTLHNAQFLQPINPQITNYTLALTDGAKVIVVNDGSANTQTLPQQSSVTTPSGYFATYFNKGAGMATIAPQGAETIVGNTLLANGASAIAMRDSVSTNWLVFGGTSLDTGSIPLLIPAVINSFAYSYTFSAPFAFTITNIIQNCSSLATAGTFTVAINGTPVTGLSGVTITTATTNTAATAANVVNPTDVITITMTSTLTVVNFQAELFFEAYRNV